MLCEIRTAPATSRPTNQQTLLVLGRIAYRVEVKYYRDIKTLPGSHKKV
jgi:hypothetical protein